MTNREQFNYEMDLLEEKYAREPASVDRYPRWTGEIVEAGQRLVPELKLTLAKAALLLVLAPLFRGNR